MDDKNFYDGIPIKDDYIPTRESIRLARENNKTITLQNNNKTKKEIEYSNKNNITREKQEKNVKVVKIVKKKRKLKTWVWIAFLFLFIIIILFSCLKLFFWNQDNQDTSKMIKSITENTNIIEKEDNENTELINEEKDKTSDYWYYITFPLIDVDIKGLKEKNKDTIGWIHVNNTNVNYPFVHTKDNDYYLNHSFDKSINEAGWVFMDYRNNKELNNKNTILYAHSRLDKTMFGSLSKVLKPSWYENKDNHIIRLSTETENTLWQIFSVYKIKEESYYITTNFANNEEYQKFLNTIKERSIYNFNTNLNTEDKILTLSTCYSDTERTVVHAKLIKKSPK